MRSSVLRQWAAVLACAACVQGPAARAAEPAPPLSSALDPAFYASDFWKDGQAEIAQYDMTVLIDGIEHMSDAVLVTMREEINREYHVKAEWPWGQKPVYTAIRQSFTATLPRSCAISSHVLMPLDAPPRALRMTATKADWDGSSFRDFRLWSEPATVSYFSPKDGIGGGEWTIERDSEARLEEELPLVLRALRFEQGLVVRLSIYTSQAGRDAGRPSTSPAALSVAEALTGWSVRVEANDGRVQEFVFGRETPHHLVEWIHSDGRHFRLREHRRSAYWLAQP